MHKLLTTMLLLLPTAAVASEGRIRLFDVKFDGRTVSALFIVCAGDRAILIDPDLAGSAFEARRVLACDSGKPVRYRVYDYPPPSKRLLSVAPGTCVGAPTDLRLATDLDPPLPLCIKMDVSVVTFLNRTKSGGIITTTIQAQAEKTSIREAVDSGAR